MIGLGNNLNELRLRIQKIREDLEKIEHPGEPLPEVINMTNVLRLNEYLTRTDTAKSELISCYEQYLQQLEQIVSSLLSIQSDLRDIIRTEASLLDNGPKRKKGGKSSKKSKKN